MPLHCLCLRFSPAIFDFRFKEHFGQKQTRYPPPPLAPSVKVAASIKKKRTESASFVCQRKATTTKAITATTTNNNTSNDYNTYACACVCVFLHILRTIRVNVLAKPEVDLDTLELLLYPAMSECVRVECVCVCSSVCLCVCISAYVYSHLFAAFCRTFSACVSLFLGFFL